MKIIEAMKKIKDLMKKVEDLSQKAGNHCADLDMETPLYPDQKRQVSEWMQSIEDTLQEIARLKCGIQKTNITVPVTILLGDKQVTKVIAEWIHRRRDLAKLAQAAWSKLGDRSLREGNIQQSNGTPMIVKIRRYYDPVERDNKVALYRDEPSIIDANLEIVNAVTEVIF